MLGKEQWLEVGAMELDPDDVIGSIHKSAIEVEQLLPDARESIKENARLDEKYWELCKQVSLGGLISKSLEIQNKLLGWKTRIYVPDRQRQQIIS